MHRINKDMMRKDIKTLRVALNVDNYLNRELAEWSVFYALIQKEAFKRVCSGVASDGFGSMSVYVLIALNEAVNVSGGYGVQVEQVQNVCWGCIQRENISRKLKQLIQTGYADYYTRSGNTYRYIINGKGKQVIRDLSQIIKTLWTEHREMKKNFTPSKPRK